MSIHRMRTGALAALALALASCGSSSHQATSVATTSESATSAGAPSQSLVVSVSTPKTEPTAGGFWPIVVRAHTATGAPASGTVSYAFLFGGAAVARRPGGQMRGGVFHDRLEFPGQAVGYPLTVQVIVHGPSGESGSTERSVTARR